MQFEDILIIIILFSIGLLLITLGIYLKTIYKKFETKGVTLDFKVKDSKKEDKLDKNNNKVGELYITTFEFLYKEKKYTETINTSKEFEKNKTYSGTYLPNSKLNKISVAGEGFNLKKGGPNFIIFSGTYIILMAIAIMLKLKIEIILITTIILLVTSKILRKLQK